MNELQKLYPVNLMDDQVIDTWCDPETGEIIDAETVAKELQDRNNTEQLQRSLISRIKVADATAKLIDDEIENLKRLKQVQENRGKSAKWFLLQIMQAHDMKKIDFGTCGATRRANPGRIEIGPDADVKDYEELKIIEKVNVNKKKLKADIEAGKSIKGVKLIKDETLIIK